MLDPLARGFFCIKNKVDTFGSRLLALCRAFSMYGSGDVHSPKQVSHMLPDLPRLNFDVAMAYTYSLRFTVLSYINSISGRDKLWPQKSDTQKASFITQFVLSSPPSVSASDDYICSWWVGKYLRDWILNQRNKEVEAYKKFKMSNKPEYADFLAYHSGAKNCGCFFPPSRASKPNADDYSVKMPDDFKLLFSSIHRFLDSTSYRWGLITASGINNEIPTLVKVVFSGFKNLKYYRSLIAQDPIWEALVKLRSFVSNNDDDYYPCWLETSNMPRTASKEQHFVRTQDNNQVVVAILEKSLSDIDHKAAETIHKVVKSLTVTLGIPCKIATENPAAGTEVRLPTSIRSSLVALINVSVFLFRTSYYKFR
jgi:hypothetical protein